MPLGEQVEIPNTTFVRCPLVRWKLRQARRCNGCEHFAGLSEQMSTEGPIALPFETRFGVRCGFPVDRELYPIDLDEVSAA